MIVRSPLGSDTAPMQSKLSEHRTPAERGFTAPLGAPLRAVGAGEAIACGRPLGKWGKIVQSASAATRGLMPRSVDPGGTDR